MKKDKSLLEELEGYLNSEYASSLKFFEDTVLGKPIKETKFAEIDNSKNLKKFVDETFCDFWLVSKRQKFNNIL